jgi:hypothetical protein
MTYFMLQVTSQSALLWRLIRWQPKSSYGYGFVDKKEEEHEDLGGAIDLEKPVTCSASLCRFACLRGAREEGKPWDLLALQPIFLTFCT